MGFCQCTSKTVLGFLGLLFTLCAFFLWGVSGYVIATYHEYDQFVESQYTLVPAVVAIAVGIVFFFAGILGCCGMFKDNRCILTMFAVFLLALLVLLAAGIGLSVKYKTEIKQSVYNETTRAIHGYSAEENSTSQLDEFQKTALDKQVDYVQEHLKCCGVDNASNWESTKWGEAHPGKVPESCCKSDNCTGPIPLVETSQYHSIGCYKEVLGVFESNIRYILGTVVAFMVLLSLGVLSSIVLCFLKRKDDSPYFSLN
jgi:hypothetical protein